eukprot:m51a1_g5090 hypothetical protein (324) ;mRNA; r:264451-265815
MDTSPTSSGSAPLPPIEELEKTAQHGRAATESEGEIHYWVYGAGRPVRVVLLEGLDSTHYGWEELIAALAADPAARFSVLAVDNRGSGLSRPTAGPYTTALMARDTRAALADAGWWPAPDAGPTAVQKMHVVGLSMGGMIAQELVMLCPAAFESAAFVSAHMGGSTWSLLPALGSIWGIARLSWTSDERRTAELSARLMFSRAFLRGPEGPRAIEKLARRARLSGPVNSAASTAQTRACFSHNTMGRLEEALAQAGVRSAVFVGTGDEMVDPKHGRAMAERLGCPLHIAPGAGHQLNDEEPQWFTELLVAHITAPQTSAASSP